ncbi:uncharacterized protein LOC101851065 [Aplysia californica]|uniref:Uncharacterized protein LOC101851065 n=1 Tax=Aplysia californica TaxID=6500 RepID=A0ABM0JYW2_APLCA|nr:uncharacterized protein LOC101851065 [Aplysia californica]
MTFGSVATLLTVPLLCATFFASVTSVCDTDYMYKEKEVWNWFKFQKLDSSGRAKCAVDGAFINGFRRQTVYKDNTTKDGITGLRAMCCRQADFMKDVGCVHKDWSSQRYK